MTVPEVALTVDEAVLVLDPPITCDQLAGLIAALGIRPVGKRQQPKRGRPRLDLKRRRANATACRCCPLAVVDARNDLLRSRSPSCTTQRLTTNADHNGIRIRPTEADRGSGSSPGERR
jgi:hypothetical protein